MNSTGQNGEKAGYRVILLLVVGLTAFSSAMKELNQLQQFTLETSRLVAQWSAKLTPAEIPAVAQPVELKQTVVKLESCEIRQSLPSVELPWLSHVVPPAPPKPRAVVPRPSQAIDIKLDAPKPSEIQIARLKKFAEMDIEPVQFQFRVNPDAPDAAVFSELPVTQFKAAKSRKYRDIRINPRDREMLLKTFNRSINLRIAS